MVLLLSSLVMFALAYGLPAFRLWQVNREIEATRRELEYSRLQQQELLKELERWNDPEVISRVAREQLGLVKPGEMRFVEAVPVEPNDPFRVEKRKDAERPLD
jgi:cell division protein FtsB